MWVRPEDAASLGRLVDTMAATPTDRPVLVVPCLPIATFLPDRRPLSRFIWLWPRDAYADRDSQIIRRLEERPDASIVYVLMHTPFAPRPQAVVPDLYAYLAEHYRPVEVVGSPERMLWGLAGRRPPAQDPAVRLTERLGSARAVRSHDGIIDEVPVRDVAGLATWPLTPGVLHVTPGRGGENRVMIPVDVPDAARLVLRVGVNPDLWQSLRPFPVRLRVAVVEGGRETEVFSVEKDVYTRTADRLWTPVEIDLGPWAGKHVEVVLGVEALGWDPQAGEVAGFEEPRVVVYPPSSGG